MRTAKISSERFRLNLSERDAANGLYAAMKAEVERRGRAFQFDVETRQHILEAARWLIAQDKKIGLMLCGLYGNGKTTLAKAIANLVEYVTEREHGFSHRSHMKIITSKRICKLCLSGERFKEQQQEYDSLFREPMLIIDDLGEEPKELMVFGMLHTPLIDLISERYEHQRLTIITTNLNKSQLEEKYGKRIYDRFCEMLTPIIFTNESYRS